MKLCLTALHRWKDFVSERKSFNEKKKAALDFHRKTVVSSTISQLFEAENTKAWSAQAKSGMSENELRVALKYGRRWRMAIQKNIFGRSGSRELPSLQNDKPLVFKPRSRPAPRKPEFLFDFTSNKFKKTLENVCEQNSQPQTFTGLAELIDNRNLVLPAGPPLEGSQPPSLLSPLALSCYSIDTFSASVGSIDMYGPDMDKIQADLLEQKARFKSYIENKLMLSRVEDDLERFSNSICDVDIVDCLKRRKELLIAIQDFERTRPETKQSILKAKEQLQHFRHQLLPTH
jgi:hypothetical protein